MILFSHGKLAVHEGSGWKGLTAFPQWHWLVGWASSGVPGATEWSTQPHW